MKELKVRLWDGNNKCFEYPDILELNIGLEYQLFTGFLDKSGKEIYDGDIIRPLNINGTITDGLIRFVRGCFVAEQVGAEKMNECLGLIIRGQIEIIGNIYEVKEG